MIYTKPINEISYEDVAKFCEQKNRESFILDYKEILPDNEKLAKSIAAFANTYGGLLLIGVKAGDGFPQGPFVGFDHDNGLNYEEKIQSVILSYIRQPLFPEIKVCGPINGKSFIVIRIAESNLTPHRIGDKVRIYVRTGELSSPIDEVNWERLEWLKQRRQKSINLRESLDKESEIYFDEAFKNKYNIDPGKYPAILTLKSYPLFPQNPLTVFRELMNDERYIMVDKTQAWRFPAIKGRFEPIQNGVQILTYTRDSKSTIISSTSYINDEFVFVNLNSMGCYTYKEKMSSEDSKKQFYFKFSKLIETLHQFLKSSYKFYSELGYWGNLYFKIELRNLSGCYIKSHGFTTTFSLTLQIPRNELKWEKIIPIKQLEAKRTNIIVELVADISWSLGLDNFGTEKIKEYLLPQYYVRS